MKKLLLTSIPKSGTNMLTQAIGGDHYQIDGCIQEHDEHPAPSVIRELTKYDRFARSHLPYHPCYIPILEGLGIQVIFLYRDPRDCIVSWKYWILRTEEVGGGFINFITDEGIRLAKTDDPIKHIISKSFFHWHRFLGWMDHENVLSISYEDMLNNQQETFDKIVRFNGLGGNHQLMKERINPSTCSTFRKGIIGDWKEEFTTEHEKLFWEEMKDIMETLGYE